MGSGSSSHTAVAGSNSATFMDASGNVRTLQEGFNGVGQNGVLSGQQYSFHNAFPVLGSLTFDMIAILTVALISIALIKWKMSRRSPGKSSLPQRERPAPIEMVTLFNSEHV